MDVKQLTGKIDFGIITVREDEFRAVLQRFSPENRCKGRRHYEISRVPLDSLDYYSVALVRCPEQGEGVAQAVASDLIEDLDPQWLLLVGIAGGVPDDEFTLGDVVAAMRLHDFCVEATLEDSPPEYDVRGGPMHREVQSLLANLPAMEQELAGWNSRESIGMSQPTVSLEEGNFYGDEEWKNRVRKKLQSHFGPSGLSRQPLVTTASIASSDRLVKNTKVIQTWRKAARHICAVEMELAGVYQAARQSSREYPILAIRGISDIVGFDRDQDWIAYACNTAAAFAYAIVTTGFLESSASLFQKMENDAPQDLSDSDQVNLARLLKRSGRAEHPSRKALCIEIGVDPDNLDFLANTSTRDFSYQLVRHLYQTDSFTAILQLCNAIAEMLRGDQAAKLTRIRNKLVGQHSESALSNQNLPHLQVADPFIKTLEEELRMNRTYWQKAGLQSPAWSSSFVSTYFSQQADRVHQLHSEINVLGDKLESDSLRCHGFVNQVDDILDQVCKQGDQIDRLIKIGPRHPMSITAEKAISQVLNDVQKTRQALGQATLVVTGNLTANQHSRYIKRRMYALCMSLRELQGHLQQISHKVQIASLN